MDTKILEEIKTMIEKATLDEYQDAIVAFKASLNEEGFDYNEDRLEAALLRKLVEDEALIERNKNNSSSNSSRAPRVHNENPNSQRFFINLGSFDGIDSRGLKELIIDNISGLQDSDFSDSYIKDKFSFFELPKDRVDEVMQKMNGIKFNGREVSVELSERKQSSSNYNRRDGGSSSYGRRDFAPRGGGRSSYRSSSSSERGGRDGHGFSGKRRY